MDENMLPLELSLQPAPDQTPLCGQILRRAHIIIPACIGVMMIVFVNSQSDFMCRANHSCDTDTVVTLALLLGAAFGIGFVLTGVRWPAYLMAVVNVVITTVIFKQAPLLTPFDRQFWFWVIGANVCTLVLSALFYTLVLDRDDHGNLRP